MAQGVRLKINAISVSVSQQLAKLSMRERLLTILAAIVLTLIVIYGLIYQPLKNRLLSNATLFEQRKAEMATLAMMIAENNALKKRKKAIEQAYQEVEIAEGALTLLESMIRLKLGLAPGAFLIKDRDPTPFGGGYEQTSFSIKFTTVELDKLVEFLKELTTGSKPMILKSLSLKRRNIDNKLDVDMEVTSIRKITENS
ncbi:MAG TPA: hypothetical protein PKD37_06860 [Oligoflexia bacterium]|nr:hypothetical protein [Oligoflexia bacterium]HMP27683.1 hypothetical protein [Oligoflexia bacterium]